VTFYSALTQQQRARRSAGAAALSPAPAAMQRTHVTRRNGHLLPARPDSVPIETEPPLPLQRKLAIGSASDPLEAEADAVASRAMNGSHGAPLRSRGSSALPSVEVPPIVHEALRSPGRPLDAETRAFMEPRLGRDLGAVRIHTEPDAAQAAHALEAQAYTVGQNIFFGAGRYRPQLQEGRRLLAHELSHTVQQAGGGPRLSGAARGVYRDPIPKTTSQEATSDANTKKPKTPQATIPVPLADLAGLHLTPPSLLAPEQRAPFYSPGTLSLGSSGSGASTASPGAASPSGQTGPPVLPAPYQYTPGSPPPQTNPAFSPAPPGSGSAAPTTAPKAPDRVSLYDFGRLSIGARIGFPDLSDDAKPGQPPSALQESIKKGEILNFILTGQPPSEYSVDPSKLVGAIWGIFSTKIDPALAAKIASGLSSKPHGSGPRFELDATILLDLGGAKKGGGGGATFTVYF